VNRLRVVFTIGGGVLALCLPMVLVPITTHTSWSTIWAQFAQLSVLEFALLGAVWLTGLFVHSYVSTGALPGLGHRRAMVLNLSGSTVSHLAPFGGLLGIGLGYTMVRSWGFDGGSFTVLTLLTNAWNLLVKLLLPMLALVLLVVCTDHNSHALLPIAVVSLLVFAVIAAVVHRGSRVRADRAPGRAHRATAALLARVAGHSAPDLVPALRTSLGDVVRTSWRRMSVGMFGYVVLQATLLWLCLAVVGGPQSAVAVFAAYAMGAVLTLVPLTPGGVGFAEAGTAGLLVAFGGNPAAVAAGVLLYSTFTRWMEIPFGAAGTAWWWMRRVPAVA
jgi:uncharacterized membrane protein YbhN (UPF0104 family)